MDKNSWLEKISPVIHFVGRAKHPPHWAEPYRITYDSQLVLVSRSTYVVETHDGEYSCPDGSFVIIPPALPHVSREVLGLPGHRSVVLFDWVYSRPMIDGMWTTYLPARPDQKRYHTPPDYVPAGIIFGMMRSRDDADELYKRLWDRWINGNARERLTCRGLMLELLTMLLWQGQANEDLRPHMPSFVSKAQDILIDLSHQPIDIMPSVRETLEENLNHSYEHIGRSFKKHLGITPLGFINALRMERAKLLLRDTNSSVRQVASLVGFGTQAYFSRRFHAHVDTTPRQFRQDCGKS